MPFWILKTLSSCELLQVAAVEISMQFVSEESLIIHSPEQNRLNVPRTSSADVLRAGPHGARGEPKVQDGSLHLPHERSMRLLSGDVWFAGKRRTEHSPLIEDLYAEY